MASTSKLGKANGHCCEYCQKEFSSKSNLNAHRKIHLVKTDFKCSFCEYASNFKQRLNNHIRSHTKERPYKCKWPNCKAAFSRPPTRDVHQKLVHKKDDSLKKFKCPKCPYETGYKSNLSCHLKTHSDVKPFACDLCPYRAKQKSNISQHYNAVHLALRPFKCQHANCECAFSQKSHLHQHQLVHNKEDESLFKFECPECDYKAASQRVLNRHLAVHSEVKPFVCGLCPFRSNYKQNVKQHCKTVHSMLKSFACRELNCSYSAKRQADLTRHRKIHVDLKEFVCAFPPCTFKTKHKPSLKKHEMTHRNEKPFKCYFCSFRCTQMNSLSDHIRRHTGETPFSCPNCPFRAKSSSVLTVHLKRHH